MINTGRMLVIIPLFNIVNQHIKITAGNITFLYLIPQVI